MPRLLKTTVLDTITCYRETVPVRWALPLFLLLVAGCADPGAQAREDAKMRVLGDAMFYWRCEHQPVVTAGDCDRWAWAYEDDLAALRALTPAGK